jgi:hypothetical protein
LTLFPPLLLLWGNVNFTNLSRYSELSEKPYRRQYSHPFDCVRLNAQLIAAALPPGTEIIGAMACSVIPKRGKQTDGLDWFYNGSASRTAKGLEISVIAIVEVVAHQGYPLGVQQTPARLGKTRGAAPAAPPQSSGISWAMIEAARERLQTLPPVAPSRIDRYLQHLQTSRSQMPADLTY